MASIERRQNGASAPYWRVVWYQRDREPAKQHERFDDPALAAQFKAMVESRDGDRWPPGWIPGAGFDTVVSPMFAHYAARTVEARLKADEQTKRQYAGYLTNHINPVIGNLPLTEVDRFRIAEVVSRMNGAGKSAKTIANVHGFLSSVLDDAMREDPPLIRRNPARGMLADVPNVKGEEMVFLTPGEYAQLEFALPDGMPTDLVRILVGTGLRWSEATALQVHAVDLKRERRLWVYRAWKKRQGHYELGEPKTRRSRRYIDLSDRLIHTLSPYVDGMPPHAFVFTSREGRPIRHPNFYNRIWRPALLAVMYCDAHRGEAFEAERLWKNAKARAYDHGQKYLEPRPVLPGCHCEGALSKRPRIHDLRHTHASWLIDAGISLPEIQRRLGHESIQTTIDRYGHPSGATSEINAAVDERLQRATKDHAK